MIAVTAVTAVTAVRSPPKKVYSQTSQQMPHPDGKTASRELKNIHNSIFVLDCVDSSHGVMVTEPVFTFD